MQLQDDLEGDGERHMQRPESGGQILRKVGVGVAGRENRYHSAQRCFTLPCYMCTPS